MNIKEDVQSVTLEWIQKRFYSSYRKYADNTI